MNYYAIFGYIVLNGECSPSELFTWYYTYGPPNARDFGDIMALLVKHGYLKIENGIISLGAAAKRACAAQGVERQPSSGPAANGEPEPPAAA